MTMGSKFSLLALGAAWLVSACAPRKIDLGGAPDASVFYVGPDGAVLDGTADAPDAADALPVVDAPTDLGPPCIVGGTSALEPTTLGCAQAPLGRVVVAGGYVYWTVQGGGPIVLRAPLNGGGPEALASDSAGAFGILVDDRFVTYTQPARGRVMRVPVDGHSEPQALATKVAAPSLLATDGKSIYWTGAPTEAGMGVVEKLDLAPEAVPVTLADGQALPRAIAVRDGFVYWTDFMDGTVLRAEDHLLGPADAAVRTVTRLASGLKNPTDLLLVGDFAYVPDRAGHVVRVPLDGGALEIVTDVDGQPYGLATDGASLYWSVLGNAGGIFAGPLSPSIGKGARFVGGQPDPHFLAVTSDNVYWAAWGPRPSLRRLAR
jgi:hypothetical protein